jgi:osmotically-inducible protein OsmY
VLGARDVNADALEVRWWAKDPARRSHDLVTRTPDAIEAAVVDALRLDPRVSASDVAATATGSSVTLKGSVSTLRAKRVAESIARNTTGVALVDNQIVVAPTPAVAQGILLARTTEALVANPITESFEIDATASAGVITLRGTVDSYAEKAEAEDVASTVPGVIDVENELSVSHPLPFVYDPYTYPYYPYRDTWKDFAPTYQLQTDAAILQDIEDEMFWSPFVDANQVTVTIDAGVATLTGTVNSFRESAAATENAFEGGAVQVPNRLHVAPLAR